MSLFLIVAMLEFTYQPQSPWVEVLGGLFGIGAALTLDEFALWLHMEDVYWTSAGRKSIDAVVVAIVLMCALLLGSTPFGVSEAEDGPDAVRVFLSPESARKFATRSQRVISAGRPPCPLCVEPLDPDGHVCVRTNGYRRGGPLAAGDDSEP